MTALLGELCADRGNPLMLGWGQLGEDRVRELVAYVPSLEKPDARR